MRPWSRVAAALAFAVCIAGPARGEEGAAELLEKAGALSEQGKPKDADVLLVRALDLARASGDTALEDKVLTARLDVVETLGRWIDAKNLADAQLELRKRLGNDRGVNVTRIRVANAAANLGDLPRALFSLDQALAWFREHDDVLNVGNALVAKAVVFIMRSDWAQAFTAVLAGRDAFRARHSRAGEAYALATLAALQARIGDYPAALRTNADVLALTPDSDVLGQADAHGRLGEILLQAGRLDEAEASFGRALETFRRVEDEQGICLTLFLLGSVERARARVDTANRQVHLDAAAARFTEAKALTRVSPGMVAVANAREGDVLTDAGRTAAALQAYARAAEVADELQDAGVQWRVANGRARAELARGELAAAQKHAREAARLVSGMSDGLADGEQLTLRASEYYETYEVGVEIALARGDAASLMEFIERERGAALLEALGGRRAMRGVGIPEPLAATERDARAVLIASRKELAGARESDRRDEFKAAQKTYAAAFERHQEAIRTIQRERKNVADLVFPVATTVSELQAALAPDEAFVAFALRAKRPAVALVVRKTAARIALLGDTALVEDTCARLRLTDGDAADWEKDLRELGRLVLEPLGLDSSVRTIVVSPHRALCCAPWSALAVVSAPLRSICLVPSASTFRMLADDRARKGKRTLALGNPAYAAALGQEHPIASRTLAALPKSREEILAITGDDDLRLLGADATEERFLASTALEARWRTVHLACHGLVHAEDPDLCALALTPADGDDGYLTTPEILAARIPADLVVLSACDTGLGPIQRGEGVLGFVRAFFLAGAPRVVASLWRVEDDATSALMKSLHRGWKQGMSAPRALAAAQAELRADGARRHPRHWAGWVAWGLPD